MAWKVRAEHSSARLEVPSTLCRRQYAGCEHHHASNFFHVLRRQMLRNFRKPLVVMSPKSLLRHKLNTSTLQEMGPGTHFWRVLGEVDELRPNDEIKRVVLCSGKVYYDLLEFRRENKVDEVAIVRIEQLYPGQGLGWLKRLACIPMLKSSGVRKNPQIWGRGHTSFNGLNIFLWQSIREKPSIGGLSMWVGRHQHRQRQGPSVFTIGNRRSW